MAETQLTHKLRNPKSYNEWMNIWTSHIQKDNDDNVTYEIYPSSNWKIPISQLTSDTITEGRDSQTITENDYTPWPEGITVPVNQIADINNIHNVTTTEGTQNHLVQFGTNREIINGPEINSVNGNENEFLNKKGNWATISGEAGITVDGTTIKHSNTEITSGTAGTSSVTFGTTVLEIPYITYDNYGHITAAGTHPHNLEGFLTSGGSEPINGSRIIGNNSLSVSVINSNGLNDTIRSKLNTQTEAGVVAAGNGHNSEVWSTDSEGNPAWTKITADHMAADLNLNDKLEDNSISGNKLNTQLFGAWIATSEHLNTETSEFNNLNSDWDQDHCGIWIEI